MEIFLKSVVAQVVQLFSRFPLPKNFLKNIKINKLSKFFRYLIKSYNFNRSNDKIRNLIGHFQRIYPYKHMIE